MDAKPFALSVKAVVLDPLQRCLLLKRSAQSTNNAGKWDLPGGKCNPGETLQEALVREVQEETGLKVQLTRVVGSAQAETANGVAAFLLIEAVTKETAVRVSDEHETHQWVPAAQLDQQEVARPFRKPLRSYAAAARKAVGPRSVPLDWYEDQIERFRKERCRYKELARAMTQVLEEASATLGLHNIVQARAKTVASFAEKIQRSGKYYTDPMKQLTDLCGARVITHTLSGVEAVRRWVEKHFDITWADSGNKLESLAASEFGYLSWHYIVSFKPDVFATSVVPPELLGLKAELQVRTILQHAWADINHELSYKNAFKLPRRWQRDFARLAAVLEEADRDFELIARGLDEYAASYRATGTPEELHAECAKLSVVLKADPDNAEVAHRLAKLAMSLEKWDRAIAILQPFAARKLAPLLRDLGVSLCKLHREEPTNSCFAEGQRCLGEALQVDPSDVDAWASLAGTHRTQEQAAPPGSPERAHHRQQAHDNYQRAFEVDPSDPFALGNFMEYEMATHPGVDIVSYFRPSLEKASRRCRLQAEVGMNLPWAFFDLAKFQLLLHEPHRALGFYARGVKESAARFFLESALKSFATLETAQDDLPGFAWCRDFLRLAMALRFKAPSPIQPKRTGDAALLHGPVVIVAGYCDQDAAEVHRIAVHGALEHFCGTVIGGGTEAGISGLVGGLPKSKQNGHRKVGYVPGKRADVKQSTGYDAIRQTEGADFSPQEALAYWADLAAAVVPLNQVKLLAIGGGAITTCECQMALALGVPVGLVDPAGSNAGQALAAWPWLNDPGLLSLPAEVTALRQFLGF